MKHTPGPWEVDKCETPDHLVDIEAWGAGRHIGAVSAQATEDEAVANAHLIAAAPDLLEAMKKARRVIAKCGEAMNRPMFAELTAIDATIAKAEGKA